jgi:hypothetical protein
MPVQMVVRTAMRIEATSAVLRRENGDRGGRLDLLSERNERLVLVERADFPTNRGVP